MPPDTIVYDPEKGTVEIGTEGDSSSYKLLAPLFKKKLSPTADIYLTGCETAKGDDNLAKALSEAIGEMYPHVTVTGNERISRYFFGKIPTITSPRSYVNGKLVPK